MQRSQLEDITRPGTATPNAKWGSALLPAPTAPIAFQSVAGHPTIGMAFNRPEGLLFAGFQSSRDDPKPDPILILRPLPDRPVCASEDDHPDLSESGLRLDGEREPLSFRLAQCSLTRSAQLRPASGQAMI